MRVVVVGQGYVGLTAATSLAAEGHEVVGVERDASRLATLEAGRSPIFEPGLQELLTRVTQGGRLTFRSSVKEVAGPVDTVVIAVASPPLPSGGADLRQSSRALADVLQMSCAPDMIVAKSTIPPGTSDRWVRRMDPPGRLRERYAHSPEFFSQGTALRDWRVPTRIVVGTWNEELLPGLRDLYRGVEGPWVVVRPVDAELIKYSSNAFLATKISFINEIANLSERVGGDVDRVVAGLRLDPRIGESFWRPGVGYGDSCLPKDVAALIELSAMLGCPMPLLQAVQAVNNAQCLRPLRILLDRLRENLLESSAVAVLGLSYEPHSDDIRAAPSLAIMPQLVQLSGEVRAWDPLLPASTVERLFPAARHCTTLRQAVEGADVILVLTEFPEVRNADWREIAAAAGGSALIIDAKNCLDPAVVTQAGLHYQGVGRQLRGPVQHMDLRSA